MGFPERLQAQMDRKKLSQNALAVKTNGIVSVATINAYLHGEGEPNLSRLKAIAKALDTTVAYFADEIESPSPEVLRRIALTQDEIDALGFRARFDSGDLADPEKMADVHRRLLYEYLEIKEKRLRMDLDELEGKKS